MSNSVQSIRLDRLVVHPDNPNRMSRANFLKLVRNIKRAGRYEPLIVRPHPEKRGCFQIINGHHRCKALAELGYEEAEAIVWDVDDGQADILLVTLNRLGGSDVLDKKLAILKRLNERIDSANLAKLLPYKHKQIDRLVNLKMPEGPAEVSKADFALPMVFFLSDIQKRIVEKAMAIVEEAKKEKTRAARNAFAIARIAERFLENSDQ